MHKLRFSCTYKSAKELWPVLFYMCFVGSDCSIRVSITCMLLYRARVQELLAIDTTPVVTNTHCTPQEEEDGYYSSYTHFGIHEEMLRVCLYHPQLLILTLFISCDTG